MLHEEQNIQWKHYINVLNFHKTFIRFELIVFLFRSEYI